MDILGLSKLKSTNISRHSMEMCKVRRQTEGREGKRSAMPTEKGMLLVYSGIFPSPLTGGIFSYERKQLLQIPAHVGGEICFLPSVVTQLQGPIFKTPVITGHLYLH